MKTQTLAVGLIFKNGSRKNFFNVKNVENDRECVSIHMKDGFVVTFFKDDIKQMKVTDSPDDEKFKPSTRKG